MARFMDHIGPLLEKEGGYVLTYYPADRGGRTYAGISERWHPNWPGWALGESELREASPVAQARVLEFYQHQFWRPMGLSDVKDDGVAAALLSCAVLSGVATATRMAQKVTARVTVDGIWGPRTLAAVEAMQPTVFRAFFCLARINRYSEVVGADPSQAQFLRGWINRAMEDV